MHMYVRVPSNLCTGKPAPVVGCSSKRRRSFKMGGNDTWEI